MKRHSFQNLSTLFGVLSDQTRLRLIAILRERKEMHVSDLCRLLKLPQPTVSHHLGLLRMHGLVRNRRNGKQVFYSIDPAKYNRAGDSIRKLVGPVRRS